MTAREWIDRFAAEVGAGRPGEEDFAAVLELAAAAAHGSERIAAPVACWIAGGTARSLTELIEVAEGIGDAEGP